jgi:hypothetical protein
MEYLSFVYKHSLQRLGELNPKLSIPLKILPEKVKR